MKEIEHSQALESVLKAYEQDLLETGDDELFTEADFSASKRDVGQSLQAAFEKIGRRYDPTSPRRRTTLRSTPLQSSFRQSRPERVERLRAAVKPTESDAEPEE